VTAGILEWIRPTGRGEEMLGSTRIKTEIPGPKSRELMQRRYKAVS
jgi:hypothetical protein